MTTNLKTKTQIWRHIGKALSFALLLLAFTISPVAFASKHHPDSVSIRLPGVHNLTAAQKTKIRELRNQAKKDALPIANLMAEKKAHLRTQETAEKTDMAAINTTIEEIQNLKTKMMKLKAAHKQEIRKILTPEQRLEFDTRSGRHEKHHRGHGKRED